MANQSQTGVKDKHYDLMSVLYHSLQGAEELNQYIQDAQDDQEVADYFRQVQKQYQQLAQQGKQLLAQRLGNEGKR